MIRRLEWWLFSLFARMVCSIAGHWPQHADGGPEHDLCWCERCGLAIRQLGGRWWLDDPKRKRWRLP